MTRYVFELYLNQEKSIFLNLLLFVFLSKEYTHSLFWFIFIQKCIFCDKNDKILKFIMNFNYLILHKIDSL